jgi:tetratricopeptide (TPR) repeat protein
MGRKRRADSHGDGRRERDRSARLRARFSRRGKIAVLAVGAAAAALLLIAPRAWRTFAARDIPRLPELGSQPSAVQAHLREAFSAAAANPSNAAIGSYCRALHADMLLAEAEHCYGVLETRDSSAWAWSYYRILILNERGGGDDLARDLRLVAGRAPDFAPAWWRLGEAEFKRGRYGAATEAWSRAAAAPEPDRGSETPAHTVDVPVAAYAALGLARVALAEGRATDAHRFLTTATMTGPRFGLAYRLLAETNETLGRRADAARAQAQAARLPAFAPYADPMVDALARVSHSATFLLRQASEADPETNGPWSEFLLRRALEFEPGNPDVLAKLGRVLRNLGRNDEALDAFRAYHEKVPGDFEGTAQVGSSLTELGRLEEAERFLREALTGLDDARTHYNLGVVLSGLNRSAEASAEYRRALDRDPYLVDARNNLAAQLAREGRLAEASAELERVLELEPDNARALANLRVIDQRGQTSGQPSASGISRPK